MSNVKNVFVICYTNHALDSFLETLLDFTPKIIRIGGQSKSVKLEAHNLATLKMFMKERGLGHPKVLEIARKIHQSGSSRQVL
jgi:hypothetical protein